MGMIEVWQGVLTKPKETFASEKPRASLGEGIKHYVVASLIGWFIAWVFITFLAPVVYPQAAALQALLKAFSDISLLALPFNLILGTIVYLAVVGLMHVIAKVLGGTGSYEQMFYLMAITGAALTVVGAFLRVILAVLVQLGPAVFIISLLFGLYALYVLVQAIKVAHSFSALRALAVVLLPAIIIILLFILFAFTILASLASFLGALASQGALPPAAR